MQKFVSECYAETVALGERLGKTLKGGEVLAMFGGMGMMGSAPAPANNGMDMFGGMGMMSSAPTASSGDIFGSMSVPMTSNKPAASKPKANIGTPFSLLVHP